MNAAWTIVPVKTLAQAKSRLGPALDQAERAALSRLMSEDVLRALRACPGLSGTAVLTADAAMRGVAHEFGCSVIEEDPALDLSANLQAGSRQLAADGAHTVVIVPMDLPTLEPADVQMLLRAHQSGITVCPAVRDGGTNALAMTPPDASDYLFGPDSASRHLDAARRRGLAATRLEMPAFARDVDTVDDVIWLCGQPGGGAARQYLERSGICARLLGEDRRAIA